MVKQKSIETSKPKVSTNVLLCCLTFGYFVGVVVSIAWCLYVSDETCARRSWRKWTIVLAILFSLSFSTTVRCIGLLMIPIFCSTKGRSTVIALAYIFAISGPIQNFLRNIAVVGESMSCGQQQLKIAVGKMLEVVKRPIKAVKDAVRIALKEIKKVFDKVVLFMKDIEELSSKVVKTIKSGFNWLGDRVSLCNKKIGTPFQRCYRIADKALADCREKLGLLKPLCNVTKTMHGLCYSVKFIDLICVLVDFVSDKIVQTVTENLTKFSNIIRELFYVKIEFEHDFRFRTVMTKNFTQVGRDIFNEIHSRISIIFVVFDFIEIIEIVFCTLVILKAIYYRYRYLNNLEFHNFYITKSFKMIEDRRKEMEKDLVLPLTWKERGRYIAISNPFLVRSELWRVAKNMLFLLVSTLHMFCLCYADYILFWMLARINYIGKREAGLMPDPYISISVNGSGIVADVCRGIIKAFEPAKEAFNIDPVDCLPNPYLPNYFEYLIIGSLMLLAWILLFFEPFALRLRIIILNRFYPERDHARALWLHSEILLERTTFLKLARRQARSRILKDDSQEPLRCLDFLRAKTNKWWICRKLFGKRQMDLCFLCGTFLGSGDNAVKCPNIGCSGKYCPNCFEELLGKCFICREPIDYDDGSDFSEEKGSSDDGNLKELVIESKIKSIKGRRKEGKKSSARKKNKKISKKNKKQKLM